MGYVLGFALGSVIFTPILLIIVIGKLDDLVKAVREPTNDHK